MTDHRRPSNVAIGMPNTPQGPRRRMSSDIDSQLPVRDKRRDTRRHSDSEDDTDDHHRLRRRRQRRKGSAESPRWGLSPLTMLCLSIFIVSTVIIIIRPSTLSDVAHSVEKAREFKGWNTGTTSAPVAGVGKKETIESVTTNAPNKKGTTDADDDTITDIDVLRAKYTASQKALAESHANLVASEHLIQQLSAKVKSLETQLTETQSQLTAAQTATSSAPTSTSAIAAGSVSDTGKCICPICTSQSTSNRAVPEMPPPPPDAFYKSVKDHEKTWLYCPTKSQKHRQVLNFCPTTPNSEQNYQLSFYDQWNSQGQLVPMTVHPNPPSCIQLPPDDYQWPVKHPMMPAPPGSSGTHWHNMRVGKLEDLKIFNPSAYKNLYHFDAPKYDLEFEKNVQFGEKYIPLASKIRLALDVGSGGGSFGLWLKHKYDIQSLSIAFPDWPYCEYITERGNLCAYLDAFHAFPFAKFSFDLVHVSWVYHSMDLPELEVSFRELYRITRPGGYLWMSDGWSNAQVAMMEQLIQILGLVVLYDHRVAHHRETYFGKNPYEVQWWTILLKPIQAKLDPACDPAHPQTQANQQINQNVPPIKPVETETEQQHKAHETVYGDVGTHQDTSHDEVVNVDPNTQ